MCKGCVSVRIWWLNVQVLSGWDALQCMAVVLASRRVDATANGYSKRGTVETIAGGAVLRSEQDQGGQAGSHTPEHHRTGELLTVTEYLFATGTRGAVPKEAHGCLEDVIQAQGGHHGCFAK